MMRWSSLLVAGCLLLTVFNLFRTQADQSRYVERVTQLQQSVAELEADKTQLNEQLSSVVAMSKRLQALEANRQALNDSLKTLTAERAKHYERLEHENAALRAWGAVPLPADVARLRERPAFTSAAAYREWLSAADTVPAASESSDAEPRPAATD